MGRWELRHQIPYSIDRHVDGLGKCWLIPDDASARGEAVSGEDDYYVLGFVCGVVGLGKSQPVTRIRATINPRHQFHSRCKGESRFQVGRNLASDGVPVEKHGGLCGDDTRGQRCCDTG